MTRLVLINPNTNAATTQAMCAIARRAASGVEIEGRTVARGVPMITDPAALSVAADAVLDCASDLRADPPDGVIVGAFGDPGHAGLAARLPCPVVGIGAASMQAAAENGRSFAVVTVTPDLVASITAMAERLGLAGQFRGVVLTDGAVHQVMASQAHLTERLEAACRDALDRLAADALVIGGGPLGAAADRLARRFAVPVINPIVAAVHAVLARIERAAHA